MAKTIDLKKGKLLIISNSDTCEDNFISSDNFLEIIEKEI